MNIKDESQAQATSSEEDDWTEGQVNEAIMQSLLEQGRLRLDQLINSAAVKLERAAEQVHDLLQRHFFGLVQVPPHHVRLHASKYACCNHLKCASLGLQYMLRAYV